MESIHFVIIFLFLEVISSFAEDGNQPLIKKLLKIKPVGSDVNSKSLLPLPGVAPSATTVHYHNGRRHLDPECNQTPRPKMVESENNLVIFGDYYDDGGKQVVEEVIFPDHIDHKHFEVTSQVPYLTVGRIAAIGFHAITPKSEFPSDCEKIYQDHMADEYSDGSETEESMEMARMPMYASDIPEVEEFYQD